MTQKGKTGRRNLLGEKCSQNLLVHPRLALDVSQKNTSSPAPPVLQSKLGFRVFRTQHQKVEKLPPTVAYCGDFQYKH